MISAALLALSDLFTPPFRSVLFKSLGLTAALLVVIWIGAQGLLEAFLVVPYPWLDTTIAILAGIGVFLGLVFLVPPITSAIAGFFLDEIAQTVEQTRYPHDAPGRELPLAKSLALTAKFTLMVIAVNLFVLLLTLLPGINFIAFFIANGYLLGREYFELAAMRFHSVEEAKAMRQDNGARVFFAGVIIAGFVAIPIVNLLTPLFATAFMVHMHKRIDRRARDKRA
ncbi:sulfate transporter family protein [Coralliovum pocilloporae]|uniref:sulfate transporter family protein n=1 Tax=Coralliovum pocilloporae TaxID=3066369 RepID=UPI0033071D53